MIRDEIEISNGIGLQSRAAAIFVQIANKFKSRVSIEINNKKVDAKSILGLMAMGIYDGAKVDLTVSGEDEQEAFEYLKNFLCEEFDEQKYLDILESMPNHNDDVNETIDDKTEDSL